MNALSDIIVKRFNIHREPQDQIKTRLVYAPKQRVLADLLDKDQNLQLPVAAVYIGGLSRDTSRVQNKILGTFTPGPAGTGTYRNDSTPLPVDLGLNLTIATRFQADMDQIISNIIPYINPYFVVSWRTAGRPDNEIRSNVFWDGQVNFSYPFDIAATQVAKVIADLSFTFKGWMFQALSEDNIGSIYTINTTYNGDSPGIPIEYLLTSGATTGLTASTDNTDFRQIVGVPPQPKIIDPYTINTGELKQFNVFGAGFRKIENVYLSGAPLSDLVSLYDPFSAIPTLSASNPPFTAVRILSSYWAYNRDNYLTFVMPSASAPGWVDLIVEGPAGYGTLTDHVRVDTFNPFLSSSPEFGEFVPYQMPFLSGIEVKA